jgi:hypothetical protein
VESGQEATASEERTGSFAPLGRREFSRASIEVTLQGASDFAI